MDADRIPIADLQPGDQFRLSHVLPVVTVERIGNYNTRWRPRVHIKVCEETIPMREDCRRLVWRVKGQAQL